MKNRFRTTVLVVGIGLATAAIAQPVQQSSYQGQMPPMGQMGQGMDQMGQGMSQTQTMMNDRQMRTHMAQMAQACGRMMSMMGDHMRRPNATRR